MMKKDGPGRAARTRPSRRLLIGAVVITLAGTGALNGLGDTPAGRGGARHAPAGGGSKRARGRSLEERIYDYGRRRGSEDARAGVRYASDDPRLPLFRGAGSLTDRDLVREVVAAPPRREAAYLRRFAEGYRLGRAGAAAWPASTASGTASHNLTEIGFAVLTYAFDHGDRFPPMRTSAELRRSLRGYVPDARVFLDQRTGRPLVPNPRLSGAQLKSLTRAGSAVCVYEPDPRANGSRAVLFADGSVRLLSPLAWGSTRAENAIPR